MPRLDSPCRRATPVRIRPLRRPERAWLAPRTDAEVRAIQRRLQASQRQAVGAFYLAMGATGVLLALVLDSIIRGVTP